MAAIEVFDIFDGQMERIGTATREETHRQGLWHQTFHCWVINDADSKRPRVLLQLRHPDKDTFPNFYDTSCAGHLQAGETRADGVRELEEELGLVASYPDLAYKGLIPEETYYADGRIDREFTHVHTYRCHLELEQFTFQVEEITGLFYADLALFRELIAGTIELLPAEGLVTQQGHAQQSQRITAAIRLEQLTPISPEYANLLFGGSA